MEAAPVRVLVVDDNPGDARLAEYALTHEPEGTFRVARADRISTALERLGSGEFDAVLLDLGLPDSQGTDGLRRLRERAPNVAVIVLTGAENPTLARAALAAGAQDYLVKGIFPKGALARTLGRALEHERVEAALREPRAPEATTFSELARFGDGVAVLGAGAPALVSGGVTELTGFSGGPANGVPAWLAGLARGSDGGTPPGDPDRAAPTANASDAGEVTLERPDGRATELEYVVRRFSVGGAPRIAVFLRETARQRRAGGPGAAAQPPERLPPSGKAPAAPAPPGPSGSGGPLDEGTWDRLRELAGTDPTFLPSLVAAFLAEGRQLVERLESLAAAGDRVGLVRTAHSLKSGFAQLGAVALSRRCAALEALGNAGDIAEMRSLVREVARGFPDVAAALAARSPAR